MSHAKGCYASSVLSLENQAILILARIVWFFQAISSMTMFIQKTKDNLINFKLSYNFHLNSNNCFFKLNANESIITRTDNIHKKLFLVFFLLCIP